MQHSNIKLKPKYFIWYKFFNSLFLGLSTGSIFLIYAPLEPSIFSIGGIILALGTILVAKIYNIILNIKFFFLISLFVEIVILIAVVFFLIKPYNYMSALIIYSSYQLTFIFGSYLLRAETLILKKEILLSRVDIAKQTGSLSGMLISFVFYKILEYGFDINSNEQKIYYLHFLLIICETLIIYLIFKSFKK